MLTSRFTRLQLVVLLGIILIAAFLRLYRLDSLPPGDNVDSAEYGLDAFQLLRGEWAVFFPTNRGREALYSYFVAAAFWLLEPSTLAIYATSAMAGILTIPLIYLIGQSLFAVEDETLKRWGPSVAALMVAVSYWHLNWSRFGVRAIIVPIIVILTIYYLYRGLHTGSRAAYLGCGLYLGLSFYTYQSARALPLLVLLGFGYQALAKRKVSRDIVKNAGLVFAIAGLVLIPLVQYALTHPDVFNQRTDETLVFNTAPDLGGKVVALGRLALDVVMAFSIQGDDRFLNHIPGRPALNPFLSVALLAGIVVSIRRVRRLPYALLLSWLVVMTLPAILAIRGSHEKRAIGSLPAVALLIAVGLLVPWDKVRHWAKQQTGRWAKAVPASFIALVTAGFIYTGVATYRDYFVIWGSDPDLFTHFEAGIAAMGRYIGGLPADEGIYLSPTPADHMSLRINSSDRPGIASYNGRVCLVVPTRPANDVIYVIVPGEDKTSLNLLQTIFPGGGIVHEGPLHYQRPYFIAYRVVAGSVARLTPGRPLTATWDDQIDLLGYDLDPKVYAPGDEINLTLYYQRRAAMETNYTVFVQLLGPPNPANQSPVWAQDDSEPCRRFYPTSVWAEGEVIRDLFQVKLPPTAPAGSYQLIMGFYNWQTGERLTVRPSAQAGASDHLVLQTLSVAARR